MNMFIRHADSYRDKRVVVVGFGNTACDAAVDLSSVCSQVTLYHWLNDISTAWSGQES